MYLYSYNKDSQGAKELSSALGIRRIKHENSKFKGSEKKKVINWGSTQVPEEVSKSSVFNHPDVVRTVSNKLHFFRAVGDRIPVPEWTESHDTALQWIAEGHTVCARTVLNGHSANGLVLMSNSNPDDFVRAPLYTKYIPKTDEYRVHVVRDRVIDVQRKALRTGYAEENEVNWKVRNLANGFIYARNGVAPPQSVLDASVLTIREIGLDFGAVDVIFNEKRNQAYVLEVNSAPGLEGQTVINYAEALKAL